MWDTSSHERTAWLEGAAVQLRVRIESEGTQSMTNQKLSLVLLKPWRTTTSADPSVECWWDVTRQEDSNPENSEYHNIHIFTIMESNLRDDNLTYYQFPGHTLPLLPNDRQVASGILTGVNVGLTSHCEIIKSIYSMQDICEIVRLNIWKSQNHFKIWTYEGRNTAGKEIEDIINSSPLELIYSDEDPATYLHCNGTRTIADLLCVSSDISELTQRKIIDDPGSGHKPVIASSTIHSKCMTPKMPTKVL
nr:hypothetical protein HmN_000134700 [Hymenolepis microstoma]